MKQHISTKLLISTVALLLSTACKDREQDKVYCQGQVIRDIVTDKDGEELSRTFELACSGECPDKSQCSIQTITYDPNPRGLIKREFCGCKGDTIPRFCDIILYTYNINGRVIQQADCTPPDTCPNKTDTCVQQNRETVDTVKTVDGKDSLYKYHAVISCECLNRKI